MTNPAALIGARHRNVASSENTINEEYYNPVRASDKRTRADLGNRVGTVEAMDWVFIRTGTAQHRDARPGLLEYSVTLLQVRAHLGCAARVVGKIYRP